MYTSAKTTTAFEKFLSIEQIKAPLNRFKTIIISFHFMENPIELPWIEKYRPEKLKDVVIERKGKKMHLNNGNVLVNIDGFVHSIYSNYWSKKPVYMFFRTIVDQYIYNFFQDKQDGIPVADAHDLYKAIKAFFHLQNYKYE